jgi:hypothetical protein
MQVSLFLALLLWSTGQADAGAPAEQDVKRGPTLESIRLRAKHRVYENFSEDHTVVMGERFPISDEAYEACAVEFLPDFAIEIQKGEKKVFSKSPEPNNPAVRLYVYRDGEVIDSVWAFPGKGAPHFSRESFIYFEILELRFAEDDSSKGQAQN